MPSPQACSMTHVFPKRALRSPHITRAKEIIDRGKIFTIVLVLGKVLIRLGGKPAETGLLFCIKLLQCIGALCLFHATSASMGSPVRLEGDAVITCHLAEVLLQLSEKLLVAFSLIQRHKGVNVGKLPPGDGLREEGTAVKRWLFSSHMTGSHFRLG